MAVPLLRSRFGLLIAVLALAAAAGGVWYALVRPASQPSDPGRESAETQPDPRVAFPTPYRNVRPEVRYVGDAACAGCHAEIDRSFHHHPMGRSAEFVARAAPIERFDAKANNPAVAQGFELKVERDKDRVRHVMAAKGQAAAPPYVVSADVAIGSGTRGRSYLTVAGGAVWQTPVSWFSHEQKWDVSPGFQLPDGARREVGADCLFCHVDRVEPVPRSANRYREPLFPHQASIGCERCHGPGELHVAEQHAGTAVDGPDTSIVNPKHLPAELRLAVCEQCHLQGVARVVRPGREVFDYRPGLPLEQFVTVFVRHPDLVDYHRSVGQVEQMKVSKCYTASGGKLDCTSCHDPHARPEPPAADAFYRAKCLACHDSHGCSLPAAERRAKNDSCIACHMSRAPSSNIAHTAVTDHRVLRVPDRGRPTGHALPHGAAPVVPFPTGPHGPPEHDLDRDLGVALARLARQPPPDLRPARAALGSAGERLLADAVKTWPGDVTAWVELAALRTEAAGSGRSADRQGALEAAEKAAALDPDSEFTLGALADAAYEAGRFDLSARAAGRLIELNPTAIPPRIMRAKARLRRQDWAGAEADCRAALAIQPQSVTAWVGLAEALRRQGDPFGAQAATETAAGLTQDPREKEWILRRSGR